MRKMCKTCKIHKPLEEFYKNKRDGHGVHCKPCKRAEATAYYKKDPEKHREKLYKQKYGITIDEYNDRWEAQGGVCAICGIDHNGSKQHFAVDHNHDTGEVRGLLCNSCNYGLGQFKDSEERLLKAATYLKERGQYGL